MPMTHPTTSSTAPGAALRPGLRGSGRARQAGFNFTEVLFAVMILGIGFIMIAAIFPVAIQQTKLTGEEVQASTTGRGGVNYAQQLGLTAQALPVTVLAAAVPPGPPGAPAIMIPDGHTISVPGMVSSLRDFRIPDPDGDPATAPFAGDVRDNLWRQMSGNLILPSDNRVGFVVMYRRGMTFYNDPEDTAVINGNPEPVDAPLPHDSPFIQRSAHAYAQFYVVAVQSRSTSVFELGRDARRWPNDGPGPTASADVGTLEPLLVFVTLYEGDLRPDRIAFHESEADGANVTEVDAAAEGAYVIISDDQFPVGVDGDPTTTLVFETYGTANGRTYRLGSKVEGEQGMWELAPGEDMKYSTGANPADPSDDIHENIPPRQVDPNEPVPSGGRPAVAFLVGRGYADPTDPAAGRDGPSQAIGVYSGIVPAN